MTAYDANESYQKAKKVAFKKMAALSKQLHKHDFLQRNDPGNWGFVGDINRMNELLDEIMTCQVH